MTVVSVSRARACRACGGPLSIAFCNLGEQPLANAYLPAEGEGGAEQVFPLEVRVCANCKLAQLSHVVDELAIFSDYAYLSSTSSSWLQHAAGFSEGVIEEFGLGPQSFVVEIASNDGYLLRNFVAAGIPCLGVEPAANVAKLAAEAGVPTQVAFFGAEVARDIVRQRGRNADLVIANNVIAHVPDLASFVSGLSILAGKRGIVSIEFPHLLRLINEVQFDTIYHEHYAYWSLHALEQLLNSHELEAFDVRELETHGGSLRVLAAAVRARPVHQRVLRVRAAEQRAGLHATAIYTSFDQRVAEVVQRFRDYLSSARAQGLRIGAYGAAAKGNTFLNRAGITSDEIALVADANRLKQGMLLPGSHIPIVDPDALLRSRPDQILILPWNLRSEISAQLRARGYRGGFVTAVPEVRSW